LQESNGEYQDEVKKKLPHNFKRINSIDQIEKNKINLLCLRVNNIEKAFKKLFPSTTQFSKPVGLSSHLWETDHSIIEKIESNSDSKDIYEIIEWAIKRAQKV